jgi:hypothetical protein
VDITASLLRVIDFANRVELEQRLSDAIQVLVVLQVDFLDPSPAHPPSPEIEVARERMEERLRRVVDHIREYLCKDL